MDEKEALIRRGMHAILVLCEGVVTHTRDGLLWRFPEEKHEERANDKTEQFLKLMDATDDPRGVYDTFMDKLSFDTHARHFQNNYKENKKKEGGAE